MSSTHPTALVADDEPLLRDELVGLLHEVWPQLQVVALARNGREAIERFDALQPDICFLDVRMPGLSGVEAARHIGRRAHLVFVTAYDEYAVQAFAQGVLDYLVKPVLSERLLETVHRLQERMLKAAPALNSETLLQQLADHLRGDGAGSKLRWIRASLGQTLKLIRVDDIDFLRSDQKYTLVAWKGADGKPCEAIVSTPLKELIAQLDPQEFAQVHRSTVVNFNAISHVVRGLNETAEIHLKERPEVLKVSRNFLHLFRHM